MKDYSKKLDFEINKEVLSLEGKAGKIVDHPHFSDGSSVGLYHKMGDYYDWFNYCDVPMQSWPIMEENKIGLAFVNGKWRASSVQAGYHEFSDKKAFRAAMIVYLMMKDAE